jgi:hypothetical protein
MISCGFFIFREMGKFFLMELIFEFPILLSTKGTFLFLFGIFLF